MAVIEVVRYDRVEALSPKHAEINDTILKDKAILPLNDNVIHAARVSNMPMSANLLYFARGLGCESLFAALCEVSC